MRDIIVLGGSSHPDLTALICRNLTIEQGKVSLKKFSNGETSVEVLDSVREKDVFIIQSGCGHVNDNFLELLIMISACKTASAKRVTAVLPLFPYSRQPDVPYTKSGAPLLIKTKSEYTFESVPGTPRPMSRNDSPMLESALNKSLLRLNVEEAPLKLDNGAGQGQQRPITSRSPSASRIPTFQPTSLATNSASIVGKSGYKQWVAQNGTLIANLLTCAGADRCITMDLHDPQFQGFFDIPVDNLYAKPLLKHYIVDFIPNYQDCVIVSPDAGGAKRATSLADNIGCSFALIHKERRQNLPKQPPSTNATNNSSLSLNPPNKLVATTMLVGDVKDRICILVDDLVDTSYTITRAAKLLKDQGAKYVYAVITHGIFSGDAMRRIKASAIDKIITSNSVPQKEHVQELGNMIEVLDVSRILAESIRRIHNGESVSMLFDHGW